MRARWAVGAGFVIVGAGVWGLVGLCCKFEFGVSILWWVLGVGAVMAWARAPAKLYCSVRAVFGSAQIRLGLGRGLLNSGTSLLRRSGSARVQFGLGFGGFGSGSPQVQFGFGLGSGSAGSVRVRLGFESVRLGFSFGLGLGVGSGSVWVRYGFVVQDRLGSVVHWLGLVRARVGGRLLVSNSPPAPPA